MTSPPPPSSLSPSARITTAELLGVSRDFFDKHLLPEIPHIVRGRRRIIPLLQLDAWIERTARRRP